METNKVISRIKGIFGKIFQKADGRCTIQTGDLVAALVCGLGTQDGRRKSISALRKSVMEFTKTKLSRGAFWERMASKRLLKHLYLLLNTLTAELCVQLEVGSEIFTILGVSKILLLDSSSFSLPDGARGQFPAPRNNVVPAAVKLHMLYDLFGGATKWSDITPATTHDRKGFPPLDILRRALIIFDLGYWDFQLLKDMIDRGVLFLSRVKSNARVEVIDVIKGASKSCIGFDLRSGRLDGFRGEIVEIIGQFIIPKTRQPFQSRIVGFWSPDDSSYHWYVTNLKVSSDLIYPLYRLRWQLELLWKGWKSFLHLDEISSANTNIIMTIAVAGMCAGLISGAVSISVLNGEPKEKQLAMSVQRSISFLIRIGKLLYQVLRTTERFARSNLSEMILLFKDDLHDPNYARRVNSLSRVHAGLVLTE